MRHRAKTTFFDYCGKPLLYLAISCVVLLLVSQALLLHEVPRHYLSQVDSLEGDSATFPVQVALGQPMTVTDNSPVNNNLSWLRKHKLVTVKMVKPSKCAEVYITVNGSPAGDFRLGEVTVTVFEGDYLEIDATLLRDKCVLIVQGAGLASPEDGRVVEGEKGIISVGKVKFKD